jgi:hypothetical protein
MCVPETSTVWFEGALRSESNHYTLASPPPRPPVPIHIGATGLLRGADVQGAAHGERGLATAAPSAGRGGGQRRRQEGQQPVSRKARVHVCGRTPKDRCYFCINQTPRKKK